jgi:hypothetical protein
MLKDNTCLLIIFSMFGIAACSPEPRLYLMNHDQFLICKSANGKIYDVSGPDAACKFPEDAVGRCLLKNGSIEVVRRNSDECQKLDGILMGARPVK